MSAIAVRAPVTPIQRMRLAFHDGIVVTYRNLVTLWRVPTVLVFELVQPVMFVLLFRFIYANQFNTANLNGVDYVLFLMPGIFVQNAIFGSTTTAIGIADDLKKGIIDRFRSLPMARSAVLAGRTSADIAKNLVLVLLVIGIGYLVGFSFENGLLGALGVIALVLAVSFTFSWISATVGLLLKEVEAVQAAVFTFIFPIVFVSSAFVPVAGMATWLQPIAQHNPVTYWCNLARYLSIGEAGIPVDPPGSPTGVPIDTPEGLMIKSALWIVGLLAVFVPLSIRLYRRLK
jgi:ABC-2 type transport system permease protein/oleandomycin transport system permease protein